MERGKAIEEKLRLLIAHLSKIGKSNSEIGNLVGLSRYSVRNIVNTFKTSGSVASKPRYVHKTKLTENDLRTFEKIIKENKNANYTQLSVLWSEVIGRRISKSTCHKEAKKLGLGKSKVIFLYQVLHFSWDI